MIETEHTGWSAEAWRSIEGIYADILALPFVNMLAAGTLPQESFAAYLQQDDIYLENYGREMEQLADMLPQGRLKELFRQFAIESIDAEREMHAVIDSPVISSSSVISSGVEKSCYVGQTQHVETSTSPVATKVTRDYMAHTNACISSGNLAVAMAAMLPCTWVYNAVGRHISAMEQGGTTNPYHEWIACYDSPIMDEGARLSCELCDRLAAESLPEIQEKMLDTFVKSAEFELQFWAQIPIPSRDDRFLDSVLRPSLEMTNPVAPDASRSDCHVDQAQRVETSISNNNETKNTL